jgi:hypothetical protein
MYAAPCYEANYNIRKICGIHLRSLGNEYFTSKEVEGTNCVPLCDVSPCTYEYVCTLKQKMKQNILSSSSVRFMMATFTFTLKALKSKTITV